MRNLCKSMLMVVVLLPFVGCTSLRAPGAPVPAPVYTAIEQAALARGVTPAQIQECRYSRLHPNTKFSR